MTELCCYICADCALPFANLHPVALIALVVLLFCFGALMAGMLTLVWRLAKS